MRLLITWTQPDQQCSCAFSVHPEERGEENAIKFNGMVVTFIYAMQCPNTAVEPGLRELNQAPSTFLVKKWDTPNSAVRAASRSKYPLTCAYLSCSRSSFILTWPTSFTEQTQSPQFWMMQWSELQALTCAPLLDAFDVSFLLIQRGSVLLRRSWRQGK